MYVLVPSAKMYMKKKIFTFEGEEKKIEYLNEGGGKKTGTTPIQYFIDQKRKIYSAMSIFFSCV